MKNELTNQELIKMAPAIGGRPAAAMSDRYNLINTLDVVDAFREHGYYPVEAGQPIARRRDPLTVTHRVILRPDGAIREAANTNEVAPQIYLVNSNNGRTQLHLRAGFYRFVCCNGLVVGSDAFKASIAHHKHLEDAVADYVAMFAKQAAALYTKMDEWKALPMAKVERIEFAQRALALRFGAENAKSYDVEQALRPLRGEDDAGDLWSTYNIIQEKTTQGGLEGKTATGRKITSRPLAAVDQSITYNERLWDLAEQAAA